ncbi:MAG: hypothetical protein K8S23_08305 [Candidatus Cloacimonetes bacterium]|nr:hypothetical protein [Candidatus Cloacimonadota bacterium]
MKKILGVLVLTVICCLSLTADLTEGLVAHYPFNGNTNDESGNGNNGILNGATLTADRFGNEDEAHLFDGDDDWIQIINTDDFIFNDFSIVSWIKWHGSTVQSGNDYAIFSNYSGHSTMQHYGLRISGNDYIGQGKAEYFYDDSSAWDMVGSNIRIDDGNWHCIVGVLSSGNEAKIYIDGQLENIDSSSIPSSIIPTGDLYIGRDGESEAENKFIGKIDDIRIYNRTLNGEEIQELYSEAGYLDFDTGLVAHYPFNENADDESGSGNDGMVNGASLAMDRFENYNSAYDFDGYNDYIFGSANSALNLTTQMTISVWINKADLVQERIFGVFQSLGSVDPWYTMLFSQENIRLQMKNSAQQWISNNHYSITNISAQTWHHLLVTFDKPKVTFYLNGQYDGAFYCNDEIGSSITPYFYIGSSGDLLEDECFTGKIDDIRVYNRAISKSQVQELYHQGNWPLYTRFSAEPRFGYSSLEVNFTNDSSDSESWEWDFQNDGVVDSYEQNPVFTFTETGMYDVKFKATFGTIIDSLIKTNYIVVQESHLLAPQNPTITKNGDDIILNWDTVLNADYYLIYESDDPYNDFEYLDYTTASTSYTHTDVLSQEDKKFYIVIGFDGTLARLTEFIEQNQRKNFNVDSN